MDIAKSMGLKTDYHQSWKRMHEFSHQVMEKSCWNSRQKKSYKVCEKARKTSLTRYAIALFQVSIEGLIRCNQIASIQRRTEDTISNHVRDDKRDVFCWKCHLGHLSAMDQWVRKITLYFCRFFRNKSEEKSLSTLRAKRAMFAFWVDIY